jgi:hypothetical protein
LCSSFSFFFGNKYTTIHIFISFLIRSAHSEESVKFFKGTHTHTHTNERERERERILLAWRLLHFRTSRPWRKERERERRKERERD